MLLSQGERLLSNSGGLMILYEGNANGDFISMQAQAGGDLTQLIIDGIDGNQGYQIHINLWSDDAETFGPENDIQKFTKEYVSNEYKKKIIKQTHGVSMFQPENPANTDDLLPLVELLEKAVIDRERLHEVVEGILKGGQYFKPDRLPTGEKASLPKTNWSRFSKWLGVFRS